MMEREKQSGLNVAGGLGEGQFKLPGCRVLLSHKEDLEEAKSPYHLDSGVGMGR